MTYGPVELVVVQAPRGQTLSWTVDTLRDLVEDGVLRVIDVAFIHVAPDGSISTSELTDLDEASYAAITPTIAEVSGLISDRDLLELGDAVEPGTGAGVLLLEHRWPHRLGERARRKGGKVLLHLRVPRETVAEVVGARHVSAGSKRRKREGRGIRPRG
jgi:Family of unknown function (DUF6325)